MGVGPSDRQHIGKSMDIYSIIFAEQADNVEVASSQPSNIFVNFDHQKLRNSGDLITLLHVLKSFDFH